MKLPPLLLLLCLLGLSCAPKAVVVSPLAPKVIQAWAEVRAAAVASERLEKTVAVVATGIAAVSTDLAASVASADRLRAAGAATPAELDAQWRALAGLQAKVAVVVADSDAATRNAAEQAFLRQAADQRMTELVPAAVEQDAAVSQIKTQLVQQAGNAALGKSVKWIVGIGATVLLLLAAAFAYLNLFTPLKLA